MYESGFPTGLWGLAMQTACYLYNRVPHSAINFVTPFEKFYEKVPDVSEIRIFGSRALVKDENIPKGQKLTPRAKVLYLTGFTKTGKQFFEPSSKKTIESCNAIIHEFRQYRHDYPNEKHPMFRLIDEIGASRSIHDGALDQPPNDRRTRTLQVRIPRLPTFDEQTIRMNNAIINRKYPLVEDLCEKLTSIDLENIFENYPDEDNFDIDSLIQDANEMRISAMTVAQPSFQNFAKYDKYNSIITEQPLTFKQATSGSNAALWSGPIADELKAIEDNKVWTIVERTKNMKVIPVKWILQIRDNSKYKARLVAVGCRDSEEYTDDEKAAPTPSSSVIRWFLIIAIKKKWDLTQIDFKSAFLNGVIDREKYVSVPEGINIDRKKYVCKLNKALYGLAIAPRCWNETLNEYLTEIKFERSEREPCLYTIKQGDNFALLIVYVDDCLLASTSAKYSSEIITKIENRFKIKILGYPKRFLGIDIEKRTDGSLLLHQETNINYIIKNYRMIGAHEKTTPMIPLGSHVSGRKKAEESNFPYKQLIGELLYVANTSRPDISFAVNYAARFQAAPEDIHFTILKRILRYLKGTASYGIQIKPESDVIECYVDADHGGDKRTRKSTTGFIILVYGSLTAFASRLQRCIAESTGEAEYMAICEATRELLFFARLTEELIEPVTYPISLFEDNSAALRKCTSTTSKGRLKHIELTYLKVREHFRKKLIKAIKIDGTKQLADILTKPLTEKSFVNLRDKIMILRTS